MQPSTECQPQDDRLTVCQQFDGWRRAFLDSLRVTPPRSIVEVSFAIGAATLLVLPSREQLGVLNALDQGAGDSLTQPFGMGELLARLRVVLRWKCGAQVASIHAGTVLIDLEHCQATLTDLSGRHARLMERRRPTGSR
jgi:hypothetical protein